MKAEETSRLDKLAEQAFAHDRNRLPEPSAAPSARLRQKLESSVVGAHHSGSVSATTHLGKFFGGAKLLGVGAVAVVGVAALYVAHVIGPVPQQSKPAISGYTEHPALLAPSESVRTDSTVKRNMIGSLVASKKVKRTERRTRTTDTSSGITPSNLPPIQVQTLSDSAHVTLRRRHHR